MNIILLNKLKMRILSLEGEILRIRRAKIEDSKKFLDMLLKLDNETEYMLYEAGERPRDESRVKELIRNSMEEDLVLVVKDNKDIVGFISAQRGRLNRIRHSAYIVVGLRKAYRGKRIGTELFKKVDLWAKEEGITRLELTVMANNYIGKNLYKKMGFEVEGVKKKSIYVNEEYVDEYCMAKLY